MDTRKLEQHNAGSKADEIVDSLVRDGVIGANESEFWTPLVSRAHIEAARENAALDRIAYSVAKRAAADTPDAIGKNASEDRGLFGRIAWGGIALAMLCAFGTGFAAARWTAEKPAVQPLQLAENQTASEAAGERLISPETGAETLYPSSDIVLNAHERISGGTWELSGNVDVERLRIDKPLRIEAANRPIRLGRLDRVPSPSES